MRHEVIKRKPPYTFSTIISGDEKLTNIGGVHGSSQFRVCGPFFKQDIADDLFIKLKQVAMESTRRQPGTDSMFRVFRQHRDRALILMQLYIPRRRLGDVTILQSNEFHGRSTRQPVMPAR